MITVIEAATHRRLTTPAAARAATGDDGSDEVLLPLIAAASAAIEAYLGRVLARETVRETFLPTRPQQRLALARWPVVEVIEAIEDGRIVADGDVEVNQVGGLLQRLSGGRRATWMPVRIAVEYLAGYKLDDPGRDLPADIEDACIRLVANRRAATGRDPGLRSIEVGNINLQWWTPEGGHPAMPREVLDLLAAYRVPLVA